jgi:hypothetical protein
MAELQQRLRKRSTKNKTFLPTESTLSTEEVDQMF